MKSLSLIGRQQTTSSPSNLESFEGDAPRADAEIPAPEVLERAATQAEIRLAIARAVDIALLQHLDREYRWQGKNSARGLIAQRCGQRLRKRVAVKEEWRREKYVTPTARMKARERQ